MLPFLLLWWVPHHHPHEMNQVLRTLTLTEEMSNTGPAEQIAKAERTACRIWPAVRRLSDSHIHKLSVDPQKQSSLCRHQINLANVESCRLQLLLRLLGWLREAVFG